MGLYDLLNFQAEIAIIHLSFLVELEFDVDRLVCCGIRVDHEQVIMKGCFNEEWALAWFVSWNLRLVYDVLQFKFGQILLSWRIRDETYFVSEFFGGLYDNLQLSSYFSFNTKLQILIEVRRINAETYVFLSYFSFNVCTLQTRFFLKFFKLHFCKGIQW